MDQGYVYLSILDTSLDVRTEINVKDVNRALALGLPEDGTVTLADLEKHGPQLEAYIRDNLRLRPDGLDLEMRFVGISLRDTETGQFAMADFKFDDLTAAPKVVDVDYGMIFDAYPDHRGFVLIENDWRSQVYENEARYSLVFSPTERSQQLDLSDSSVFSGFLGMVENGMHHIWIGIDHVLFLIALLLPSVLRRESWRWEPVERLKPAVVQIVKIVTMFTIGHSITLCLAALDVVTLSDRLVESVIAGSIAIAALDIVFPIFRGRLLLVVLLFGLFHGFGFANVLAEMPIPDPYIVPSLLGFNIGVELGQLVIVIVVVPLLFLVRSIPLYPRVALPAAASMLVTVSVYWFIERAFLIDLPAGAIAQELLGLV